MSRNISEVLVSKSELIEILHSNRSDHRRLFEEAMEAYKQEAIRQLEAHIERIKANSPVRVSVSLPLPEDHTTEYDTVISMLEMSLDEEVLLEEHQYQQFVLDKWGWTAAFAATYASYTGKEI